MSNTVRTGYSVKFPVDEPTANVKTYSGGTEIVFEVVAPQGASMIIKYRAAGTSDWSESSALNAPEIDDTITISDLIADTLYEFNVYGCSESDGRGTWSEPGPITGIWWGGLSAVLQGMLTALGHLNTMVMAVEATVIAGSSTTEIRTDLTHADDFFNGMHIHITGAAGIVVRKIDQYKNTNGAFTVVELLPFTPQVGDIICVLSNHDGNQSTGIR